LGPLGDAEVQVSPTTSHVGGGIVNYDEHAFDDDDDDAGYDDGGGSGYDDGGDDGFDDAGGL
jgi:hypothetical protein